MPRARAPIVLRLSLQTCRWETHPFSSQKHTRRKHASLPFDYILITRNFTNEKKLLFLLPQKHSLSFRPVLVDKRRLLRRAADCAVWPVLPQLLLYTYAPTKSISSPQHTELELAKMRTGESVRTHMPTHTPRSPITELGQMRTSNISIAVNYFFHKIFNN